MRNILLISSLALLISCDQTSMNKLEYPESRKENQVDHYWGTKVRDPYRWLENDRAKEVEQWVTDQNSVTRDYIDAIPGRKEIRDRYKELFNFEKIGMPRKIGDRYFISKNDGLQNQSVVYIRQTLHGDEEEFLDPNKLSDNGTVTAYLDGASKDGSKVVVVRNEAGSDWQQLRILNVATGEQLPDVLDWVKFSGASWLGDGFFYSRYPAPDGSEFSTENTYHSVYYHKLGENQSDDKLIFRNDDEPNRYHYVGVSEDEQFLILNTSTGTDGNSIHVKRAEDENWQELVLSLIHI